MKLSELRQEIHRIIQRSTETECVVSDEKCLGKDLGLSSMEVFVLLSDLEDAFGVAIPVKRLRKVQTVGDLSDVVIQALREGQ